MNWNNNRDVLNVLMQLIKVNVVLYYIYYYKHKNFYLTQKNKKQIKYNIPLKSIAVRHLAE